MQEHLPEIPNTKLLSLLDVKEIMEKRTLITKELLGRSCYLIVDGISNETPFLDKLKNQIFISVSPKIPMFVKTVFCRSYTLKEINDEESKNILREAFELEKQTKFKETDLRFRGYLTKVQFRFSLLSKSPIYGFIKPGDTIIGAIDKYETNRGEFLTVQSSSVRYKK